MLPTATLLVVSLGILGLAMYLRLQFGSSLASDLAVLYGTSHRSNISKGIPRKNWAGIEIGFAKSLSSFGEPMILQNTIAATYQRYSLSDISALSPLDNISSFLKHDSATFGPYYDSGRPMHALSTIRHKTPYQEGVTLPVQDIPAVFNANGPPYYSLSIQPEEIGLPIFNITELISLKPKKASVNFWLGMRDGVTPCHYDGYHNMFVRTNANYIVIPFTLSMYACVYMYLGMYNYLDKRNLYYFRQVCPYVSHLLLYRQLIK